MRKLLSANFIRLKKSRCFRLGILFMFGLGILMVLDSYRDSVKYEYTVILDMLFFRFTFFIQTVCAIFCSLFLGTEYSDGTIRNKIIVGHSRKAIYLSNLIVCSAAALLMSCAYFAGVLLPGIFLLGFFQSSRLLLFAAISGSLLMVVATVSFCTLLSMLNQNKAIVTAISITGVFLLLLYNSMIFARLNAPEYFYNYGNVISGVYDEEALPEDDSEIELVPNPSYIRGTRRAVYEFLMDLLPTGQAVQYCQMTISHPWRMELYSCFLILLSTGFGIIFFQRKDLK